MEIEGDHELSSGRKAKGARTEKLPPAVEGKAEGVSSPSAPDKVKALFTGAVMTPELAPNSAFSFYPARSFLGIPYLRSVREPHRAPLPKSTPSKKKETCARSRGSRPPV